MKTLEVYNLRCQGQICRALVSTTPDGITGCIDIPTPTGVIRVTAKMTKETVRTMMKKIAPFIRKNILEEDAADDEIITAGGWDDVDVAGRRSRRRARRARRRAKWKNRMKKLFSGKVVKKLGKVANKVLNNKLVRGAMKFAKFIPGYGQAIGAAYNVASKAAKVASNLGKGRRGARQAVSALRRVAERRATPRQRQVASSLFQGFQRGRQALQGARSMLRGRSSGIDAYTAQQMLNAVGKAYLRRYGADLAAIARQGGAVSGPAYDIVVGAACIWGDDTNALDALDAGRDGSVNVAGIGHIEIVGGEFREKARAFVKKLAHRGYTPDAPLRQLYADGLRSVTPSHRLSA